ncbi:hypothetical protein HYH03_003279 [Edaphochlamys debaryana]|uniref:Uncharacterized protein n=1 Tax=Edaphochlamys debaryana TaxID=47281 RepID=A0A835YAL4_9CHLO|nr:hypothetical protein HYH03_003279 [Edaphochlamys debaryana]|eukprot:KAG2499096.1 hypothetical protein HYH03_003279 [Edaphochlamys debaryana]
MSVDTARPGDFGGESAVPQLPDIRGFASPPHSQVPARQTLHPGVSGEDWLGPMGPPGAPEPPGRVGMYAVPLPNGAGPSSSPVPAFPGAPQAPSVRPGGGASRGPPSNGRNGAGAGPGPGSMSVAAGVRGSVGGRRGGGHLLGGGGFGAPVVAALAGPGLPGRSRSPGADLPQGARRVSVNVPSAWTAGGGGGPPGHIAAGPGPGPVEAAFRPSTSHNGLIRTALTKYTWEPEYQRVLLDAALRLPPESVPAGFMATLSSTLPPPAEAPPMEPDATALKWFKNTYPDAVSTSRRDAMAVRAWLDEQLVSLRRHVLPSLNPAAAAMALGLGQRPRSAPDASAMSQAAAAAQAAAIAAQAQPQTVTVSGMIGRGSASPTPKHTSDGAPPSPKASVGAEPSTAAAGPGPGSGSLPGPVPSSSSPERPARGGGRPISPDRAGVAAPGPPPTFSGPESMLLVRDGEGYLDGAVVRHQETLLSRCMDELAGQVATLCVERGHLVALLWQSLRHVLYAVLSDRDAARSTAQAARRAAAQAAADKAEVLQRTETEKADMVNMNDLLNRRLLSAKMEAEAVRARHVDAEAELARLRAVQPDELRRELDALKVQMSNTERQLLASQVRMERMQGELLERERELQAAMSKAQSTAEELGGMREEFGLRSPRPAQPRTPPWELLQADEGALTLTALRAGVPPHDVHRLLLGVSATGVNVLPWCHLLGVCRHIDPNGPPPNALGGGLGIGIAAESSFTAVGAPGGPLLPEATDSSDIASPTRSGLPPRRSTKVGEGGGMGMGMVGVETSQGSLPASRATTAIGQRRGFNRGVSMKHLNLNGTVGSLDISAALAASGLGGGGGQPGGRGYGAQGNSSHKRSHFVAAFNTPGLPDIREQHHWLHGLLSRADAATALGRWLSDDVVEAVAQMTNHSIDTHSIACLLLGTISIAGADIVPYKSLSGILAVRYHHTAADIGGSITEALELAAMSTADRVERMQENNKELHKMVNKLKRNLNDLRKVERDSRMNELRSVGRKVQGRRPSPVHALVLQKRPEYFMGLGAGEDVPAAMQAEGKIYNRLMEKADAERLVNTVWASKRDFEASQGVTITLPDYLAVYLQRKYGAARAAAEAAYNLIFTLGQHQYDPDCYLFFKVVAGDLDDSAREGQERLRSAVLDTLLAADSATNHGRVTGWLRKAELRDTLTRLLAADSAKRDAAVAAASSAAAQAAIAAGESAEAATAAAEAAALAAAAVNPRAAGLVTGLTQPQLSDLFDALDDEDAHEMVQYARLFEDDTDLNQGVFVETLRQQHLHNRLDWLQSIEDAVLDWAEATGSQVLGPSALRAAMLKAQPDTDADTQREMLTRVFGQAAAGLAAPPPDKNAKPPKAEKKVGREEAAMALPLEPALRRLRQERAEGMCTVAQAIELMSAGRAGKGGRSGSPRRGNRGPGATDRDRAEKERKEEKERAVKGVGGIVWADADDAASNATPRVGGETDGENTARS